MRVGIKMRIQRKRFWENSEAMFIISIYGLIPGPSFAIYLHCKLHGDSLVAKVRRLSFII